MTVRTAPAQAQEQSANPQAALLRVALSCAACDTTRVHGAFTWIEWINDRDSADVYVAAASHTAGEGEVTYALSFTGLARFAGSVDTLRIATTDREPDALQRRLIDALHVGLVRYATAAALERDLRIAFVTADGTIPAPALRDTPPAEAATTDPAQQQRATSSPAQRPSPQRSDGASSATNSQQRRWALTVDLGFTGSSGNSDLVSLSTGVRVKHLQTRFFRLDWSANFRYGESKGDVAARHTQSKLDFDMGPNARVAPFISATGERDPFRRLELKSKSGTGVRYSFYKSDRGEASLRAAALYSHERFTPEAGRPARTDGAWSFKLSGNRRIGESIRIENVSSYDPVMGEFSDYNLDVTSKLSTRINRRVALTLSHTYSYDATPARDVQRADQRFQTGLSMEF